MSNLQKEIFQQVAAYIKMVNAHLENLDQRIAALENPGQSLRRFSPGPNTLLQTIEAAIQRLPD